MAKCAIKVCRNYRGRLRTNKFVTYHRLPTDPILRSRWIEIIKKSRGEHFWKPAQYTVICSDHFHKENYNNNRLQRQRLKNKAVPSKALFLSSVQTNESDVSDEKSDTRISDCENHKNISEDTVSSVTGNTKPICVIQDVKQLIMEMPSTSNAAVIGRCDDFNQTENEPDLLDDVSLDSIYDSPIETKLKKELKKKNYLQQKHAIKIQSLRRKNIRLQKKILSLLNIIRKLKVEANH